MFKGHKFTKLITDEWVFDLTEFIGYKVSIGQKGQKAIKYDKAFQANVNDKEEISFNKVLGTPAKVLREANNLIQEYVEIRG